MKSIITRTLLASAATLFFVHGTRVIAAPAPMTISHQPQISPLDSFLTQAYTALQLGNTASAWESYRFALAIDAHNRDALLGLAVISQRQQQSAAALHYYQQVLQIDPRDPVANAGLASFAGTDRELTESRLTQLLAQQPSATLHFALGNHYAQQSRWGDAHVAYGHSLALEPNNALFTVSLAVSLDHLQRTSLALQHYQLALARDNVTIHSFDHPKIQQRIEQLSQP
jgi:tetratricopeptide (TPR) repeat protein